MAGAGTASGGGAPSCPSSAAPQRARVRLRGFLAPANPGGVTTAKAGATLPAKFSLGGFRGPDVLDGQPSFQGTHCVSGAAIGAPIPAASGEPFAYDPATDSYKFAWKTQKAWATWCGTLTVAPDDGTSETLAVRFTR